MYCFYDLNISIMMLAITLSIHNNENCYSYVLKRSIFRQVYYYPAMLTVLNNNAFASHTIHAMKQFNHDTYERPNGPKPERRNRNSYIRFRNAQCMSRNQNTWHRYLYLECCN